MYYVPFISPASMAAGFRGAKRLCQGVVVVILVTIRVAAGCQHDRLLPYRRFGEQTTGHGIPCMVLGERTAQEGVW